MKCICSKCDKPFVYKGKKEKSTCPHCGNEDYVEVTSKLFTIKKERALQAAKLEFETFHNYVKAYNYYGKINEIDNECCFTLMRMLMSKLLLSNNKECYIKEVSEMLENKSENIYLDEGTIMYLKDALSDMRKFILNYLSSLTKSINNDEEKSFTINAYKEGVIFFDEYIAIYNGIDDLSQFLNEPLEIIKEDKNNLLNKINELEKLNPTNNKITFHPYAITLKRYAMKRIACLLSTGLSLVTMLVGFIMLMVNVTLVIPASIVAGSGILLFVISYSLAKHYKKKLDKFKII